MPRRQEQHQPVALPVRHRLQLALQQSQVRAVDLTLGGREFRRWRMPAEMRAHVAVDPSTPGFFQQMAREFLEDVPREADGSVFLDPGQFLLALTHEKVGFARPSRLAARVEGKSSLARIGLAVHVTAPTIHADFEGEIALEIVNLGNLRIRLRRGMAICQLTSIDLQSQFQRQQTVAGGST